MSQHETEPRRPGKISRTLVAFVAVGALGACGTGGGSETVKGHFADGKPSATPSPYESPSTNTSPKPQEKNDCNGQEATLPIGVTPLEKTVRPFVHKEVEHVFAEKPFSYVEFDGDLPPTQGDVNVIRLYTSGEIKSLWYLQGTFRFICGNVNPKEFVVRLAKQNHKDTGNPNVAMVGNKVVYKVGKNG